VNSHSIQFSHAVADAAGHEVKVRVPHGLGGGGAFAGDQVGVGQIGKQGGPRTPSRGRTRLGGW
jgi:hypothetical protein